MADFNRPTIELNGVPVAIGRRINLIEGTNVTIAVTSDEGLQEAGVTISSSGGLGGGVDVEEDNVAVGTATVIDFGTGLDVAFSGGEADITVDTSELTVITGVSFGGNVV